VILLVKVEVKMCGSKAYYSDLEDGCQAIISNMVCSTTLFSLRKPLGQNTNEMCWPKETVVAKASRHQQELVRFKSTKYHRTPHIQHLVELSSCIRI
jgi:hypothetical protein